MANKHGDFIWYELMSSAPDKARAFYKAVAGLEIAEKGEDTNGVDYRMISSARSFMGGMLGMSADMTNSGARPCWLGYIGVDDVDDSADALQKAGGTILMPPRDMEGVGRMAMVTDPQGAPFYLMRGFSDEESTVYQTMEPGHVAWNELLNRDAKTAVDLYTSLFAWTKGESMPMGELGDYQMIDQNGKSIGAIMPLPAGENASFWRFYIAVTDIEASAAAVESAGGSISQGITEVPGGMFVLVGKDAEGAEFALVGAKK